MQSPLAYRRIVKGTIHEAGKSAHDACACKLRQFHFLLLARLEAYSGAGWNVESHPVRARAIEEQLAIHFKKMEVAAHLDWPVALVLY